MSNHHINQSIGLSMYLRVSYAEIFHKRPLDILKRVKSVESKIHYISYSMLNVIELNIERVRKKNWVSKCCSQWLTIKSTNIVKQSRTHLKCMHAQNKSKIKNVAFYFIPQDMNLPSTFFSPSLSPPVTRHFFRLSKHESNPFSACVCIFYF